MTQGLKIGQLGMLFGANDMGSLMIEENVVAEAGTVHFLTLEQIRSAITELGFTPRQRNVFYELVGLDQELRGRGEPRVTRREWSPDRAFVMFVAIRRTVCAISRPCSLGTPRVTSSAVTITTRGSRLTVANSSFRRPAASTAGRFADKLSCDIRHRGDRRAPREPGPTRSQGGQRA